MTLKRKGIAFASQLLYWALIGYLFYLALMVSSFLIFNYQDLLNWFTNRYPDAYRIDEYGLRYFTLAHYELVEKSGPALVLLLFILIISLLLKRITMLRKLDGLMDDLGHLANIVVGAFSNLSTTQKWLLVVCFSFLIAVKIYFFIALPSHVDEVFNFVYFVRNGFLHTTLFTNNHVLYNLISALWWKTGMSPEISARLTSVLSGLLINILLFATTRHYFNFKTAILVLILTGINFWTNVFSVQGSANMLMALCSLVSIISLFHFAEDRDHGYYLFTLSCILGFYCSKLFVIPFLSFILLWIGIEFTKGRQNKTMVVRILKSTSAVLLFSGLLYLPMFLWSGADALFLSNVARHDLSRMSPIFFESLSMTTELNSKSYVLILALFILAVLFLRVIDRKLKLLIALNVVTIVSILLFVVVVRFYPPSRSLVYMNTLFFGALGVAIGTLAPKFFPRLQQLAAIWLVVVVFKIWGSYYVFNYGWQNSSGSMQDSAFYGRLNRLANCIVMYKPRLIFMDQHDTYVNFYLTLAAVRENIPLTFTYDSNKVAHADIAIVSQEPTPKVDAFVRLKQDEFGMIFYKIDRDRTFSTDCMTVE